MKFGFRWHLSIVYGWPHCCCFDGAIFSFGYCSLDKCHREAPRDQSTTRLNGVLDFCFHANRGWLKTVFTIKSLRCYRSLTKSTVKDYPLTIRVDDIFPGIVISYGCDHLLMFRILKNAFRYVRVMAWYFSGYKRRIVWAFVPIQKYLKAKKLTRSLIIKKSRWKGDFFRYNPSLFPL